MKLLFTIIKIISVIILLGIPFGFIRIAKNSKLQFRFGFYFLLMIILIIISVFGFAYWNDLSNKLLLNHYGYDFDAMSNSKRYENVLSENLEEVYSLEKNDLGIGWILKAFLGSLILLIYSICVYIIYFFIKRNH